MLTKYILFGDIYDPEKLIRFGIISEGLAVLFGLIIFLGLAAAIPFAMSCDLYIGMSRQINKFKIIKMKDINNKEIRVGNIVKTQQQSGGVLPPAPPQIGIVEVKDGAIVIKYKKEDDSFNRFILLEGKINEVLFNLDGF